MEIGQELDALIILLTVAKIVHPLDVFFTVAFIACVADTVQLAAFPGGEFALYLINGLFHLFLRIQFGAAEIYYGIAVNSRSEIFFQGDPLVRDLFGNVG